MILQCPQSFLFNKSQTGSVVLQDNAADPVDFFGEFGKNRFSFQRFDGFGRIGIDGENSRGQQKQSGQPEIKNLRRKKRRRSCGMPRPAAQQRTKQEARHQKQRKQINDGKFYAEINTTDCQG